MSRDRWSDTRVERAAVLLTEQSILEHTDLVTAHPSTDFGIDLLAFRPEPFAVAPIQVKGAESGIQVSRKYAQVPVLMSYVIEPRSSAPLVAIMTGEEAWDLPVEYVKHGGKASDYHPEYQTYRWPKVTNLLKDLLMERAASPTRWDQLFHDVRAK